METTKQAVEMDSMECVCGETLRGVKGSGELYRQYQEHLARDDHKSSPAQWMKAHEKIEAAKEKKKSAQTTAK